MVRARLEIMHGSRAEFDRFALFVEEIDGKVSGAKEDKLALVAGLCRDLRGCADVQEVDLKEVACSIAKTIAGV